MHNSNSEESLSFRVFYRQNVYKTFWSVLLNVYAYVFLLLKYSLYYLFVVIMKTLDDFVVLFAEQFDDTDPSQIIATTAYHDLEEWSSLIGLSVIAMVDEEFDVALRGDDVKDSVTVEDLYNRVIAKL